MDGTLYTRIMRIIMARSFSVRREEWRHLLVAESPVSAIAVLVARDEGSRGATAKVNLAAPCGQRWQFIILREFENMRRFFRPTGVLVGN